MRPPLAIALLTTLALTLAACGGSSDDGGSAPADDPTAEAGATDSSGGTASEDDVTEALEDAVPDGTVDVPSADGATTIAEWSAGGSTVEPTDAAELTQIIAIVGTDADGYFTDDTIVVRTTQADATLLCGTADGLALDTYRVIPVLPDGTGVDCAS